MARSEKPLSSRPQVVVVDAYVEDYDRLVEMAKQKQLRLTITTTGSGALRLASSYPDALWLVSTRLPDMRGLSLLEMLKSLLPKLTAFVVDPCYDQENERQLLRLSRRSLSLQAGPGGLGQVLARTSMQRAGIGCRKPGDAVAGRQKELSDFVTELPSLKRGDETMVARVAAELQYAEYEEQERMEKMGRRAEYGMPSRRATSAKRAMKRTSASRRAGHLFSVKAGGKHQRRLRKFH